MDRAPAYGAGGLEFDPPRGLSFLPFLLLPRQMKERFFCPLNACTFRCMLVGVAGVYEIS